MPCRDYQDNISYRDVENARNANQDRLDQLTSLLCLACATIQEEYDLPERLQMWYDVHRQADLDNMAHLIDILDVQKLSKDQFDRLDKLLLEFGQ